MSKGGMERTRRECGDVNVLGFQCLATLSLSALQGEGMGESAGQGKRRGLCQDYVSKLQLFAIRAITLSHRTSGSDGCRLRRRQASLRGLPPPAPASPRERWRRGQQWPGSVAHHPHRIAGRIAAMLLRPGPVHAAAEGERVKAALPGTLFLSPSVLPLNCLGR